LPEQIKSGAGKGRWDGHALGALMGKIEYSSCETYRTCCRDSALTVQSLEQSNATSRSATCASSPSHVQGTTDQGELDFRDASQPLFCDAIAGAQHRKNGITSDACIALEKDIAFDQLQCQAKFCSDGGLRGYHKFITTLVDGVRRKYLTPGLVILHVILGFQLARLFVFRELIQSATHERAAIELHDAKDAIVLAARESFRLERAVVHDSAVALDKIEDALHVHHKQHSHSRLEYSN